LSNNSGATSNPPDSYRKFDKKGSVSKGGDGNYWRRIKNRPSPQVSPTNSEDELSVGDGEIADKSSDEEEMEEGSVGEAEEEEESGELMFGDESGGEEDWDDGTDESDGMNGRRNRLVGSWIDIVVS
jgi:hypothetical protein